MIVTAIILAIIAAVVDHFFGISEPWRKMVVIGVVAIFIVGLVNLIFPGILPVPSTRWY